MENVEKEYTIFETEDNYFKVRKQLFMKKTINWQFDVKDGIGAWAKTTLFNLSHEAMQNLTNCLRRKIDKPGLEIWSTLGRRQKRLQTKTGSK